MRAVVLDTVRRAGGSRGVVEPGRRRGCGSGWPRPATAMSSSSPTTRSTAPTAGEAALDALGGRRQRRRRDLGHRHTNSIEPDRRGFWLISTASLVDFPQQSRMFCLRGSAGGGVVLDTWMVDHDGRGVAGTARELAYLDAQGGRPQQYAGRRADRNARLYLP